MKTSHDNLDKLKEKNPFTVPEGYMDRLAEHIMSQLPEQVREKEAKQITFFTKVRPFLYMAGMFAGLGLFFKFFLGMPENTNNGLPTDSLLVQTSDNTSSTYFYTTSEEDAEYLDYVEEQCSNYLLEGEMDF